MMGAFCSVVEYVGVSEVREERPPIGLLFPVQLKRDLHINSQKRALIPMHEGEGAIYSDAEICSLDLEIIGHFKVRILDKLEPT